MSALLAVRDLSVRYGKLTVVRNVSFELNAGDFAVLAGANGAGKTSVLRAVSGIAEHTGSVVYKGTELSGMAPHKIAQMGIRHVPEGRGIFENLSVFENLKLATWNIGNKAEIGRKYEYVFALFPRLKERMHQSGGTLSGGEQQMLAVARALMMEGDILLLDEPSMGLAPMLVRSIFDILVKINKAGVTVLLVEQNVNSALKIASRGYIMETGKMVFSGTSAELLGNRKIKEAYLGAL